MFSDRSPKRDYLDYVVEGWRIWVEAWLTCIGWILAGSIILFGWPFALIGWLAEKLEGR